MGIFKRFEILLEDNQNNVVIEVVGDDVFVKDNSGVNKYTPQDILDRNRFISYEEMEAILKMRNEDVKEFIKNWYFKVI